MTFSSFFHFRPMAKSLPVLGAAAALLLIGAADVGAQGPCQNISGRFVERVVTSNCLSPVGLCIAAEYTAGPLHGTFTGSVNQLIPSPDRPLTNVFFFTTDTVIQARLRGKQGAIFVKNNGAFQTVAPGAIMDIQFITGGTGDFTGASGVIRASGTFDSVAGAGESEFVGTICTR